MSEERLIGYKPNLEYKDEYTSDATDYFNKQQNTKELYTEIYADSNIILDENRATVLSGVSMFSRIIVAIFYPLSGMLMDKNPHLTYLIIGIATIIFSILLSSSKNEKQINIWE